MRKYLLLVLTGLFTTLSYSQVNTANDLLNATRGDAVKVNLPQEDGVSTFVFDGEHWVGQGTTPGSEGFYFRAYINPNQPNFVFIDVLDFLHTNPPAGGNPFWARGTTRPVFGIGTNSASGLIAFASSNYQVIDRRGGVWRVNRDDGTSDRRLQLRSPNYLANLAILWPTGGAGFRSSRPFSQIDFHFQVAPVTALTGSFTRERLMQLGAGSTVLSAIDFVVMPANVPQPVFRR